MKKRGEIKRGRINGLNRWPYFIAIVLIVVLLSSILTIVLSNVYYNTVQKIKEKENQRNNEKIEFTIKKPLINSTQVIVKMPAVDDEGNGVITLLVVEAIPGSGRTLVDIDNLLFWADTQGSIRMAKNVAENISGIDADNFDIVYNIYANASIIGGESAGAALAIATIAALENKNISDKVIITGTVNHDGTIGPVGGILAKAKAAKSENATLFLVPLLQSREVVYESREHCEKFGPGEFCRIEQVPVTVNVGNESQIEIKEVGTIREAFDYFLEED